MHMTTPPSKLDTFLSTHGLSLVYEGATKGRAVVASRLHRRGQVLLTSQPLGAVPLGSHRHELCNYCFRKVHQSALQRCSQCKSAYFCDMACFKNAWLTYHQYVCTKHNGASHQDDEVRKDEDLDQDQMDLEMLERVALNCHRYQKRREKASTNGHSDQSMEDDTKPMDEDVDITMEAFESLMGHESEQPAHQLARYGRLSREALAKPYLRDTGMTEAQLVGYLCKFQCNNFGIHDDYLFAVGEGTYPVASLVNHSCRPNAVIMFNGGAMLSIYAIDDIHPGDDVTIAYVDAAHDRNHRQTRLRDKYFFQCSCVRCTTVDASVNTPETVLGNIDAFLGAEPQPDWWARAEHLLQQNAQISSSSSDSSPYDDPLWTRILEEVDQRWDLLSQSRDYDRRRGTLPDKSKPINMGDYTHFLLQTFTPYLWSVNNLDMHADQRKSDRPCTPPPLPPLAANPSRGLVYFDDPLPHAASPKVPDNYLAILSHAMTSLQAHPAHPSGGLNPCSLSLLPVCTKLYYDQLGRGEWHNAVKLGMYILMQYLWIYPPYHPVVAQHLLVHSKCCWNSIIKNELLGNTLVDPYQRGLRRWIMLSKQTLAVAVGKQGDQWREAIELEWIFLRDQKLKE
ncbi:hypothetical protein BC940DRAFT_291670 [Gongronella butleri]|nr:hypothetical protein BC940DRAFT_291670 [Gongronella butleri]